MPQFVYCTTRGKSNFAVRDLLHSSGRATEETIWPASQKLVTIPANRSLLDYAVLAYGMQLCPSTETRGVTRHMDT
jgi:hypothetical protein